MEIKMNNLLFGGIKTENEQKEKQLISQLEDIKESTYLQQIESALQSIRSLLGEQLVLKQIVKKNEYEDPFIGCQYMDGDTNVFFGLGGSDDALKKAASKYVGEEFETFNSDVFDAICEMINCTNGAFATRLSDQNIQVTMHPPVFYDHAKIKGEGSFYVIELDHEQTRLHLILAGDIVCMTKTINHC
jgi:hypothetical protein